MSLLSETERLASRDSVKSCERLTKQFLEGRITFEEYAYNVMLRMVKVLDDDLPSCVDLVPPGITAAYTEYLRAELEPVDFMPFPGAFLIGRDSEDLIERLKQEYRPKYLRLYQLMKEKPNQMIAGQG